MSNNQKSSNKSQKHAERPNNKNRAARNAKLEGRRVKERTAAEARVRRNHMIQIGSIAVVVLVVVTLVAVKLSGGAGPTPSSQVSPATGTPISTALIKKLDSVPLSVMAAAPKGGLVATPQAISDPPLTAAGKPDLLYIGAEFCPVCATERWAMYLALSKFGSFSPEPGQIHSALRDGDIPTITFYKTTFISPYFNFTPVETTTNQPEGDYYVTLQTPTPAEQRLWTTHTGETFPWLDLGGTLELTTAQFDPALLEGQSFGGIVSQIGNNATTIGADIDASAHELVRSICTTLTHDKPLQVCSGR
jgi:hypothetical protein